MENSMKKNHVWLLFLLLLSEIICCVITKVASISYAKQEIYSFGINILLVCYLLPFLICSFYTFFSKKSDIRLLIRSTIGLMLYSLIFHFFSKQLISLFTNTTGISNFVEYASKIYLIALPFIEIRIWWAKKRENMKTSYFLVLIRILILLVITIVFKYLFSLNGILYAMPSSEFLVFFITLLTCFFSKHFRHQ